MESAKESEKKVVERVQQWWDKNIDSVLEFLNSAAETEPKMYIESIKKSKLYQQRDLLSIVLHDTEYYGPQEFRISDKEKFDFDVDYIEEGYIFNLSIEPRDNYVYVFLQRAIDDTNGRLKPLIDISDDTSISAQELFDSRWKIDGFRDFLEELKALRSKERYAFNQMLTNLFK